MRKIASVLLLACAAFAWSGEGVSLKLTELLKDAKKYDGKAVVVRGMVAEFEARTSKRGTKYTVFKLKDGKDTASVYLKTHLAKPPANQDPVEVSGIFRVEKKVGPQTFTNEIDATPVKDKPYGVKLLPKGTKIEGPAQGTKPIQK